MPRLDTESGDEYDDVCVSYAPVVSVSPAEDGDERIYTLSGLTMSLLLDAYEAGLSGSECSVPWVDQVSTLPVCRTALPAIHEWMGFNPLHTRMPHTSCDFSYHDPNEIHTIRRVLCMCLSTFVRGARTLPRYTQVCLADVVFARIGVLIGDVCAHVRMLRVVPGMMLRDLNLLIDVFNSVRFVPLVKSELVSPCTDSSLVSGGTWAREMFHTSTFVTKTPSGCQAVIAYARSLCTTSMNVMLVDVTHTGSLTRELSPFDIQPDTIGDADRVSAYHGVSTTVPTLLNMLSSGVPPHEIHPLRAVPHVYTRAMGGSISLVRGGVVSPLAATRIRDVAFGLAFYIRSTARVHGIEQLIIHTDMRYRGVREVMAMTADRVYVETSDAKAIDLSMKWKSDIEQRKRRNSGDMRNFVSEFPTTTPPFTAKRYPASTES